jgi:hypothetical protein
MGLFFSPVKPKGSPGKGSARKPAVHPSIRKKNLSEISEEEREKIHRIWTERQEQVWEEDRAAKQSALQEEKTHTGALEGDSRDGFVVTGTNGF